MIRDINLTEYILERALSKTDANIRFSDMDAIIEALKNQEIFEIVESLPTEDIKVNKLYLVYNPESNEGNLFDVFLYVNDEWEQLDSLSFNIQDYYTKSQITDLLSSKAEQSEVVTVNGRVDGLSNSYTALVSTVGTVEDTIEDIVSELSDLNKDVYGDDTQNPIIKGLKNDMSDTILSLNNILSDLNTAKANIITLQNTNQSLSSRITQLENTLTEGEQIDFIFDEEFEESITRLISEAQNGGQITLWRNLINFKELFESWTANKTTVKNDFKNILNKLKYENGALYFDNVSEITLSEEEIEFTYGESLTLTGTHSLGEGCHIKLYQNEVLLEELVTGSDGGFSTTISDLIPGNYVFLFTYEDEIDGVITASCSVVVNKIKTNMSISATRRLFDYNARWQPVVEYANLKSVITGVLKDEYGNSLSDKPIVFKIFNNVDSSSNEVTNSSGKVTWDATLGGAIGTVREDTRSLVFEGDDFYDECQASIDFYACRLDDYMTLKITGSSINALLNNEVSNGLNEFLVIDYGDGTIEKLHNLNHTFRQGGTHSIRIYNVLGDMSHISNLFKGAYNISNVSIPLSVTDIGTGWFETTHASPTDFIVYWDTPPMEWSFDKFPVSSSDERFIEVPTNCRANYVAKGFPSNLIIERESPYDDIRIQSDFIEGYSENVVQRGTSLLMNGQLMKNNETVLVSDVDINYTISRKKDGTVIQSGNLTSNMGGQFAIRYIAQGKGDLVLNFVSDGANVSFEFEDCMYASWDKFKPNDYKTVTGTTLVCQSPTINDYLKFEMLSSDIGHPFSIDMEYIDVLEEEESSFCFGFLKYDEGVYLPVPFLEGVYNKLEEQYLGSLFSGVTQHPKPVTGDIFRLEVYKNSVNIYRNNVKLVTKNSTETFFNGLCYFAFIGDRNNFKQKWKNFKVKLL